jgi:hypothetical protein
MKPMPDYKHVGRVRTNRRKVVVAYRVVPGDPDSCLVVQTENLNAEEHDSLLKLVESDSGQNAYEFAEAMARSRLPDGRIMLAAFHSTGKINKVPSEMIEMTPNNSTAINLKELNEIIANGQGVTVADLAVKGPDGETVKPADAPSTDTPIDPATMYKTAEVPTAEEILSDEALAAQLRSQADTLFKEAKSLRDQADELAPTKKKTTTKKTESAKA